MEAESTLMRRCLAAIMCNMGRHEWKQYHIKWLNFRWRRCKWCKLTLPGKEDHEAAMASLGKEKDDG